MTGETNLDKMLAGLTVTRRPGRFVVAHLDTAVAWHCCIEPTRH